MSKPTGREVYNALAVLDRAGILDILTIQQPKATMRGNTFTHNDAEAVLNVTFDTNGKPKKKHKSPKKYRYMTEAQKDQAVDMFNDQGMNKSEIGRKLGFSAQTISNNIGV